MLQSPMLSSTFLKTISGGPAAVITSKNGPSMGSSPRARVLPLVQAGSKQMLTCNWEMGVARETWTKMAQVASPMWALQQSRPRPGVPLISLPGGDSR